MAASNAYALLLEERTADEAFVRRGLALIESGFRRLALTALSDWQSADVRADEVFKIAAGLSRPSWGTWNGILTALRKARNEVLRGGNEIAREKVKHLPLLGDLLAALDVRVSPDHAQAVQSLAKLCRAQSRQPKVGELLAWPITLRNIIAHDSPTDTRWWSEAASCTRPLIEFLAGSDPVGQVLGEHNPVAPWCITLDGHNGYFNGLTHDNSAARYVFEHEGQSRPKDLEDRATEVLLAVKKLMGREDIQEHDFRKLLAKLGPEDVKGVMLGDFLVGAPIAEGGFSTVHRGLQLSTGRLVAVKVLRDGMDEEIRARFRQEAEVLSKLAHPNIVGVYGYGEDSWRPPATFSLKEVPWFKQWENSSPFKLYIALEWVAGETLESVYQSSKAQGGSCPDRATILGWFRQAASALAAVHSIGWIHRDVKPANLMVDERGVVKIMDFGIARTHSESRTIMTQTGRVFGTEPYMSPEQLAARDSEAEVGASTDIYSLCATFYELIARRRLYDHDVVATTLVNGKKLAGVLLPEFFAWIND